MLSSPHILPQHVSNTKICHQHTAASHSLVGDTAVQLPEPCHAPLMQLAKGLPVKPPTHVVLQVAPDAAGRVQAQATPLGTLGLGWLVQPADSRAAIMAQAREPMSAAGSS